MKVVLLNHSRISENREKLGDLAAAMCVDKYEDALYNHPTETKHLEAALKSGHLSVIEHLPLTFLVEDVSRSLTHQLVRHRIASYSQLSQRYAKVDTSRKWFVIPNSISNEIDSTSNIWEEYLDLMDNISNLYNKMLANKIPGEDARYILPSACFTSIIISMNARSFAEACVKRTCNKAQWEIREMFIKMRALIEYVYPHIYELCFPNCYKEIKCQEAKPCYKKIE